MSEIQFAQKPVDAYGKEFRISDTDQSTATLGHVCVRALDAGLQSDQGGASSEAFKRGMLAHDIAQAELAIKPIDLSTEQIALIKDRVAKAWPQASLVHSVWLMLDPASKV